MQVADGKAVYIHYTLKNDAGDLLDSSEGNPPLTYIHGGGHIIPGLEAALAGKTAGDKFNVAIAAADAYGARNDDLIQVVSRSAFQDPDNITPGTQFQAQTPQGPQLITIASVSGDDITIDANHPLAGVGLVFDVEVAQVRDATDEERDHGHVHGEGGHQH